MAFNAITYRTNLWRKQRVSEMATARDIKTRAARGEAYDWEISRIATFVKLARISNRLYLSSRRVGRL